MENIAKKRGKCWSAVFSFFLPPCFNPFPKDKILGQAKLKAVADDNLNVTKMVISVFDRVETLWEKEKLLVQAISSFPTMFSKGLFPRPVKKCHCVGMG